MQGKASDYRNFIAKYKTALLCFFVPWGTYFLWLWPHILFFKNGNLFAGHPYVWADWSMHIALAANFAFRPVQHWFDSLPVYAGAQVTYPFVTNLISGLLWKIGLSIPLAFIVPSIIFTAFALVALYVFFLTLFPSQLKAALASSIALLSGGLGFFILLKEKGLSAITDSTTVLTQIPERGLEVNTIIASMFIPQRAFLLGLPVGLCILTVLIQTFLYKKRSKPFALILVGLLAGCLPLIHTHTFLVVVLFSICLIVYRFRPFQSWLFYGIPAVFLSLMLYWVFLKEGVSASAFFSWHPGWIEQDSVMDWIRFWIRNWGVFLPLAIIGTIGIQRAKKFNVLFVVLFFWFLFFLSNFIQFQPQLWDNTKLFAWVYLGLSLPVAHFLSSLYQPGRISSHILIGVLFLLITISGATDIVHNLDFSRKTFMMLSVEQIELGEFMRENIDSSAVVMSKAIVSNPVSMIGGKSVLLGYPGWAFSYGLDYSTREREIDEAFSSMRSIDSLQSKYRITHVYIDPSDPKQENLFQEMMRRFPSKFSNSSGHIFELKN